MDQPKQQKTKQSKKPAKPLKIWESDNEFGRTISALKKEINQNPAIPHPLDSIIPSDNRFHRLSEESLLKKVKTDKLPRKSYSKVLSLLGDLRSYFDAEILIKKSGNRFSIRPVLARPNFLSFELKGMDSPGSLKSRIPAVASGKEKQLVNIARIKDSTERGDLFRTTPSQFRNLFSEFESRIIPGVIKYTRGAQKLFLVYIPSQLNMTAFYKIYAKTISQMHDEFYGKNYRGRPKSQLQNERAILKALKKYGRPDMTAEALYPIAAKSISVSVDTIKRWYKHVIRKFKGEKNI